jgi:hypothetical protein
VKRDKEGKYVSVMSNEREREREREREKRKREGLIYKNKNKFILIECRTRNEYQCHFCITKCSC